MSRNVRSLTWKQFVLSCYNATPYWCSLYFCSISYCVQLVVIRTKQFYVVIGYVFKHGMNFHLRRYWRVYNNKIMLFFIRKLMPTYYIIGAVNIDIYIFIAHHKYYKWQKYSVYKMCNGKPYRRRLISSRQLLI